MSIFRAAIPEAKRLRVLGLDFLRVFLLLNAIVLAAASVFAFALWSFPPLSPKVLFYGFAAERLFVLVSFVLAAAYNKRSIRIDEAKKRL